MITPSAQRNGLSTHLNSLCSYGSRSGVKSVRAIKIGVIWGVVLCYALGITVPRGGGVQAMSQVMDESLGSQALPASMHNSGTRPHLISPSSGHDEASRGGDEFINLVVGQQRVLSGSFESQISLSRRGLINVRWLDDERVLVTALKPGVVLLDPAPVAASKPRWLIRIKSEYQARRDGKEGRSYEFKTLRSSPQGSRLGSSSEKRSSVALRKERLHRWQSYRWYSEVLVSESDTFMVMNCFHPRKEMFREMARQVWPEKEVLCALENYQLEVMVVEHKSRTHSYSPDIDVLKRQLADRDRKDHAHIYHLWEMDMSPQLGAIDYHLSHHELNADLSGLAFYATSRDLKVRDEEVSRPWRLSFNYQVRSGETQSSGHRALWYTPDTWISLADLWGHSEGGSMKYWQGIEEIPILGYLLKSTLTQEKQKRLSFLVRMAPSSQEAKL